MEFMKDFTAGLLVLILMINNVFCAVSVTCEKDRPLASQRLTCTCKSDSGNDILWTKDGVTITLCFSSSGSCSPLPSAYEFSNNVSGSINIFNATIKSFGYSSCGQYTCDDGTSDSKSLIIADYDPSLTPNWSEPPNEVGNISLTTSCFFGRGDFTPVWYIYQDSEWREYTSNEVTTLTSDSSTCTNTCGTTKAEKIIATLVHTTQTKHIESKLGLKLIHKDYPVAGLPIWSTTKTYKLSGCNCESCTVWIILDSIGVVMKLLFIVIMIYLIIVGRQGKIVILNLSKCDLAVIGVDIAVSLYCIIVGAITVSENGNCRTCKSGCDIDECDKCLALGIACLVLALIDLVLLIIFIIIRQMQYVVIVSSRLPDDRNPDTGSRPGGKPDTGNRPGGKPDTGSRPGGKPDTDSRPGAKPHTDSRPGGKPDTDTNSADIPPVTAYIEFSGVKWQSGIKLLKCGRKGENDEEKIFVILVIKKPLREILKCTVGYTEDMNPPWFLKQIEINECVFQYNRSIQPRQEVDVQVQGGGDGTGAETGKRKHQNEEVEDGASGQEMISQPNNTSL